MFTTEETTFPDIDFFQFPSFIFKENQVIVEKDNPQKKMSPKNQNNYEECGNLKVFVGGEELTRHMNKKKKPVVLQTYRCPLCDKYFMGKYFYSKDVEHCESVN